MKISDIQKNYLIPVKDFILNPKNTRVILFAIALIAALSAMAIHFTGIGGFGHWITFTVLGMGGGAFLIASVSTLILCIKAHQKSSSSAFR